MDIGIQICIALSDLGTSKFNNIINEIIKKSLFTEKQIEIILNQRKLLDSSFSISKGAYYRQVSQSREKLVGFFYSMVLLKGLMVLNEKDDDVISKLSEQLRVIHDGSVPPEREEDIIDVIDKVIRVFNYGASF